MRSAPNIVNVQKS